MTTILTHHGHTVDLLDPRPETIDFRDVAHALAHICRFGGHPNWHYSVAEHCFYVAMTLEVWGEPPEVQRIGLLHDATEAYLGDVVGPLKAHLPEYRAIEDRFWRRAIAPAFGLPEEIPAVVHRADRAMFLCEQPQVNKHVRIVDPDAATVSLVFAAPDLAQRMFYDIYSNLQQQTGRPALAEPLIITGQAARQATGRRPW